MALSRLKTSRARLLAILLAIMVPIAALMAIAAWTNHKFTVASIERDYTLLASNYASRLRVWIRGTERAMVTAAASIGSIANAAGECSNAVKGIVDAVSGYRALYLRFDNGAGCYYAAHGVELPQDRVERLMDSASRGIPYQPIGTRLSELHLYFEPGASHDVIFHAAIAPGPGRPGIVAMLLVDPAILTSTMAFGESYPGATIAAMLADSRIVASHGAAAGQGQWWPGDRLGDVPRRWKSAGGDGVTRIYASHPVVDNGLYILGGFDAGELASAWYQFLLLLALPILVIAALTIAFLHAIDFYVINWLKRMEWTARERSNMRDVPFEISDRMPHEVRSFAAAFNDMAAAEAMRRAALEKALEDNRFLVRELHHRVKNSLQVIQSYLAIERRQKAGDARDVLLDAELRVQMLSLAYRIALAEGTIQAVNLNDFLPQLLNLISSHVLARGQIATLEPPRAPALLELEKVIALAFLLASLIAGAAQRQPQFLLTLRLDEDNGETTLTLDADRILDMPPEPRINRGLLLQLGATAEPATAATRIAGWRWPATEPTISLPQRFTP